MKFKAEAFGDEIFELNDDLTWDEMAWLEDYTGHNIQDITFDEKVKRSSRVLRGQLYLRVRRTHPQAMLGDIGDSLDAIDWIEEPASPAKKAPARRSQSAG